MYIILRRKFFRLKKVLRYKSLLGSLNISVSFLSRPKFSVFKSNEWNIKTQNLIFFSSCPFVVYFSRTSHCQLFDLVIYRPKFVCKSISPLFFPSLFTPFSTPSLSIFCQRIITSKGPRVIWNGANYRFSESKKSRKVKLFSSADRSPYVLIWKKKIFLFLFPIQMSSLSFYSRRVLFRGKDGQRYIFNFFSFLLKTFHQSVSLCPKKQEVNRLKTIEKSWKELISFWWLGRLAFG